MNYDANIPSLKHGQHVKVIFNGKELYGQVGSIMGAAHSYNECPLRAIEQAKKNGHSTNPWINQEAGVLTSDKAFNEQRSEERKSRVVLRNSDRVYIEGRLGTIKVRGNYSDLADIELDEQI